MIFPIVTGNDIVICTPPQTSSERREGYSRRVAIFHRTEEMHITDRELSFSQLRPGECADRMMKTKILRRLYPREIGLALYDIKQRMFNDLRMPHGAVLDYVKTLEELSAALQPTVK